MEISTQVANLSHHRQYQKIKHLTHDYFQSQGYENIELPLLSPALVPEPSLEVFKTELLFLKSKNPLYLTPSPELFLKRLLAYGIGNCYSLTKAFRNGELNSELHSPEFTLLEFYKLKAHYFDIAEELLGWMKFLAQSLFNKDYIIYHGKKISFNSWEKISVAEAFAHFSNISEKDLFTPVLLSKKAKQKGYRTEGFTYEDIFSQIYVQEIEPHLGMNGKPTIIYDFPRPFAALAKLNEDKKTAQRFEFYIAGIELGNCYTELTDWKEQEERFNEDFKKRKKLSKISHPIDKGFIEALKYGLADCAGIGLGFDRLAMIFTNVTSIHDLRIIDVI